MPKNRKNKAAQESDLHLQTDLSFDELLKAFIQTPPPPEGTDCLPKHDDEVFADDPNKSPEN